MDEAAPVGDAVVVWGNCQAAPIAALLRAPLAGAGFRVLDVPPVFEIDEAGLAAVRAALRTAAVLVTQPVRDEYRLAGCGSEQLAALLPPDGRVITIASAFHVGPFPYLVNGHDARGVRVDAPLTVYHDLRLVAAAVDADVPPLTTDAVRALDAASLEELRRREAGLDVPVSRLVSAPGALHCFNHPANTVLADLARGVLGALGVEDTLRIPEREFLGATRAPIEPAVAAALGWEPRPHWTVAGRELPDAEVAAAHRRLYRDRPDVVTDTWQRYAGRRARLGWGGGPPGG